jgi:hypothetical protein
MDVEDMDELCLAHDHDVGLGCSGPSLKQDYFNAMVIEPIQALRSVPRRDKRRQEGQDYQ